MEIVLALKILAWAWGMALLYCLFELVAPLDG
jgi:hypothetical protein